MKFIPVPAAALQARGRGAGPAPPSPNRYDHIDVLRFIAAAAVVAQHVFEISASPVLRAVVAVSPGVFGVALFFLVSGFVMPMSVRHGLDLGHFAVRRICRIYPALLAALATWATVALLTPGGNPVLRSATLGDWFANILLYHDFVGAPSFLGVTWTLILEFFWYALFAISVKALGSRAAASLGKVLPILIALLSLASLVLGHRLPLGRIGMIYAAVIGMVTFEHGAGRVSDRAFMLQAGGFVLLMGMANLIAFGHFHHPTINLGEAFWPWVIAPTLFFATQVKAIRHSSLFQSRTFAFLGSISFSIYLFHPIAMALWAKLPYDNLSVLLVLSTTFMMALVAYYGVERPGIAFGRYLCALRRNDMSGQAAT